MVASCPSSRCSCRKRLRYEEKQRVWSQSCGLQDVLQWSDWALSCAMRLLQKVNNCRNWDFCRSEMDVWLPAFRLPMFAKCYALKESMPFVKSKPPLPTRSLSFQIVSRVRSAISALNGGIMPIPSLQLQKKPVICREAEGSRGWSRSCGHGPKNCYNTVIVLSVVLWNCCKPVNNCRDWAYSNSELDVWLPAFQLPMFAKCDPLPKRDMFHMFV